MEGETPQDIDMTTSERVSACTDSALFEGVNSSSSDIFTGSNRPDGLNLFYLRGPECDAFLRQITCMSRFPSPFSMSGGGASESGCSDIHR